MFNICASFALVEAYRGIGRCFWGGLGVAFPHATLAVGVLRLVLFYIRITDIGKRMVDKGIYVEIY